MPHDAILLNQKLKGWVIIEDHRAEAMTDSNIVAKLKKCRSANRKDYLFEYDLTDLDSLSVTKFDVNQRG